MGPARRYRGAPRAHARAPVDTGRAGRGRYRLSADPRLRPEPFWFLRHGETDWNAQGLSQGQIDIPLNARGREQAVAAAALLPGRGIRSIVTSTLSRAHDTALVCAEVLALPVETDPELMETRFGAQEHQPMAGAWFEAWVHGRQTPEGAETFAELRVRARGAINRALDRPARVLVVAHGALFRSLRAEMGLEPNVRLPNAIPVFCAPPVAAGDPWSLTVAI